MDGRASLANALERLAVVPRWRITSVALAALLLAIPAAATSRHFDGPLTAATVELVALLGLGVGWILLDRMAALRVPMIGMVLVVIALAVAAWHSARIDTLHDLGLNRWIASILAISFVFGGLVRGATDARRSMASLVAIAAVATWLTYDIARLPNGPLRDIHLYLGAGTTALRGASPYLTAPITSVPNLELLPFVYPPFTIPLFEVLVSIPRPIADTLWTGGSIAAVVAAFWLLGVRGRWLIVMLAWPAPALGIAVGNVASYTFLLYALAFRFGAALVLSGIFKVQSTIPALWLVRERRWRAIAIGIGIIAVLAIISVPIVGLQTWAAWPNGLRFFQDMLASFPQFEGLSLARPLGPALAAVLTVGAVLFALFARGRNSLARFGVASIVGSPTLYFHGLSPLLAGALFLGPEMVWFFLGLGPWPIPFALGIQAGWVAIGLVGAALLVVQRADLRLPDDLSLSRADVHPASQTGQVWPERSQGISREEPIVVSGGRSLT
jgi:Glycosyltransferase family 87